MKYYKIDENKLPILEEIWEYENKEWYYTEGALSRSNPLETVETWHNKNMSFDVEFSNGSTHMSIDDVYIGDIMSLQLRDIIKRFNKDNEEDQDYYVSEGFIKYCLDNNLIKTIGSLESFAISFERKFKVKPHLSSKQVAFKTQLLEDKMRLHDITTLCMQHHLIVLSTDDLWTVLIPRR